MTATWCLRGAGSLSVSTRLHSQPPDPSIPSPSALGSNRHTSLLAATHFTSGCAPHPSSPNPPKITTEDPTRSALCPALPLASESICSHRQPSPPPLLSSAQSSATTSSDPSAPTLRHAHMSASSAPASMAPASASAHSTAARAQREADLQPPLTNTSPPYSTATWSNSAPIATTAVSTPSIARRTT
eukprot:1072744-Rhodomonas_salina.1